MLRSLSLDTSPEALLSAARYLNLGAIVITMCGRLIRLFEDATTTSHETEADTIRLLYQSDFPTGKCVRDWWFYRKIPISD
jgi:hypothetical protein